MVQIEPVSDTAGKTAWADLDAGGSAEFPLIYPGVYYVSALGVEEPVRVELEPGADKTEQLVIP